MGCTVARHGGAHEPAVPWARNSQRHSVHEILCTLRQMTDCHRASRTTLGDSSCPGGVLVMGAISVTMHRWGADRQGHVDASVYRVCTALEPGSPERPARRAAVHALAWPEGNRGGGTDEGEQGTK